MTTLRAQGILELSLLFIGEIKDHLHDSIGHRYDFALEIGLLVLVFLECRGGRLLRGMKTRNSRNLTEKAKSNFSTGVRVAWGIFLGLLAILSIAYENSWKHVVMSTFKATLTYSLIWKYRNLFTFCEAALLASVLSEFLMLSTSVVSHFSWDVEDITQIADVFLVSAVAIPLLCMVCYEFLNYLTTAIKIVLLSALVLLQTTILLSMVGGNPINLVRLTLVEEDSIMCLVIMGIISLVGIATSVALKRRGTDSDILRKVFHIQIVAIFLPGVVLAPRFTLMAVSGLTWVFLLVEFIRQTFASEVRVVNLLDKFVMSFIDQKDCKQLVVTHIYLLLGIVYPFIYFFGLATGKPQQIGMFYDKAFAGVIVLGIGDSFAAIVGKTIGKIQLFGQKKTLEGLLAFLASSMAFVKVFNWVAERNNENAMLELDDWFYFKLLLVGLIETTTTQVDNLLLPLLFLYL